MNADRLVQAAEDSLYESMEHPPSRSAIRDALAAVFAALPECEEAYDAVYYSLEFEGERTTNARRALAALASKFGEPTPDDTARIADALGAERVAKVNKNIGRLG